VNGGAWAGSIGPALAVVVVDQAAKRLAVDGALHGTWIEPVRNADLALGLAGGPAALEILGAVVGILLLVAFVAPRFGDPLVRLAAGLAIGGAAANLIDRLVAGSVVDFIAAGPIVLNPADIAIVAGIAILAARRRRMPRMGVATLPVRGVVRPSDRPSTGVDR
jgi:signal peptidase II